MCVPTPLATWWEGGMNPVVAVESLQSSSTFIGYRPGDTYSTLPRDWCDIIQYMTTIQPSSFILTDQNLGGWGKVSKMTWLNVATTSIFPTSWSYLLLCIEAVFRTKWSIFSPDVYLFLTDHAWCLHTQYYTKHESGGSFYHDFSKSNKGYFLMEGKGNIVF